MPPPPRLRRLGLLQALCLLPALAGADEVRLLESEREAATARAEMVLEARGDPDGERVVIGSYNLDSLSERLNSEIILVIDSREAADTLRRTMDANLERAWRIDERGMPEGQTERYPGIPKTKLCKLRLLRLMAPFIEGML